MSLFKIKIKVAKQKKITNRIIRQVEACHCFKSMLYNCFPQFYKRPLSAIVLYNLLSFFSILSRRCRALRISLCNACSCVHSMFRRLAARTRPQCEPKPHQQSWMLIHIESVTMFVSQPVRLVILFKFKQVSKKSLRQEITH